MFISVESLDVIYSRFSIHRQSILQIFEIKQSHKFISICQELSLHIWGFTQGKAQIYRQYSLFRPVADIKVCGNLVFMGFKSGDTEMFEWDERSKEFFRLQQEKIDEHEEELVSLDMDCRGLFVTGGRDGLVKIWNIKKELIREIKFPEPITSVCFLNSAADILVGHVGKVSSVLAADYKPFETPELALPNEEEVKKFMKDRTVCSESVFKQLKKLDDDIRKQMQELTNHKQPKLITNGKFYKYPEGLQCPLEDNT